MNGPLIDKAWIDEVATAPSRRDFHATYLTDPTAMAAAQRMAATTGEDGWAAAWTLAQTLPPAFSSHDAAGAREILAPSTRLSVPEEAGLRRASSRGYYRNPNIALGNSDMAPSMVRQARPGETVRPDLRCPPCCGRAGEPEESGMPGQVYRCTDCGHSWEYQPPQSRGQVDDVFGIARGQFGVYLRAMAMVGRERAGLFDGEIGYVPGGVTYARPAGGTCSNENPCPDCRQAIASEQAAADPENTAAELARRRQQTAELLAEAFEVPVEFVTAPTLTQEALDWAAVQDSRHDADPMFIGVSPDRTAWAASRGAFSERWEPQGFMWASDPPAPGPIVSVAEQQAIDAGAITAEQARAAFREFYDRPWGPRPADPATERSERFELRNTLEMASRNPPTELALGMPLMREAIRRGLVREDQPSWRAFVRGMPMRVGLTPLGQVELLRVCRELRSR
jgi:hypothetical protein